MTGYEKCGEILAKMKAKHPDVGLTFGYIGNVGVDRRGRYDERRWSFYTMVPNPSCRDQNKFRFGYVSTDELDSLAEKAEAELDAFLTEKVEPHVAGRWRSFRIVGTNMEWVTQEVKRMGGSFGMSGGKEIMFGIRFYDLDSLRAKFSGYAVRECEW